MDALFAYITFPSLDEARRVGEILVEERLAACVNILPEMESWYRWKGAVENARETVMIAKTRADARDALQRRVLELHPYECPCVVFWPLTVGNPAYLEWILHETETLPHA